MTQGLYTIPNGVLGFTNDFFDDFPAQKCHAWINKLRLRLFNWRGTIKKYQMTWLLGELPPR